MKRTAMLAILFAVLETASPAHAQRGAKKPSAAKHSTSGKVSVEKQTSTMNEVAPKEAPKGKKAGIDQDFGKLPTYVRADNLTLKNKERNFVYQGNVEVTHGDMVMTANSLEGNYDEKNQIKDLTAHNNVTIIKGEDIRATGEKAVYDKSTDTLELTESPELQQNGSVLTADKIRIFMKENRSVAEGQVRVKLLKGQGKEGKLQTLDSLRK